MEKHNLTDEDIIAYVQYEAGLNEYFKLNDSDAARIKKQIFESEKNTTKYKEFKASLDLTTSKEVTIIPLLIKIAAIILICLSTYYFLGQTNSVESITMNDFNLKILRSETDSTQMKLNQFIFELREERFLSVLQEIEKDSSFQNTEIHAAALILYGQKTNDSKSISKAIIILEKLKNKSELIDKIQKTRSH